MTIFTNSFIDISRVALWSENSEGNKSKLIFGFRNGYPRITVIADINSKNKENILAFPLETATAVYILNLIKEAAKADPGFQQQIQFLTTVYENDQPTKDKKLHSTLYIGKSKDGIVYISVVIEERPKIVFPFKQSSSYIFKDKDGNFIPDSVISTKIAIGISDLLLNIISQSYLESLKEEYTTVRKPTLIKKSNNALNSELSIEDLDNLSI